MEKLNTAYLSLGSNIEDRFDNLQQACFLLKDIGEIHRISSIYESEPLGFEAATQFLNLALSIETKLSAHELLKAVNVIESDLGRVRSIDGAYISRTIDIDIIFYNNAQISSQELTIPHPFFNERNFVLVPLNEIAEGLIDPQSGKTISDLLNRSIDNSSLRVYGKRIIPTELI